ncbi:hypothetical protein [Rothia nasimurium]|uniref:hypothetical protein n=1 Tax=Rothia nasimurium TaxID=85336 RepID=UPI003BA38E36
MKATTTTQALGLSATLLLAGGALVPAIAQDSAPVASSTPASSPTVLATPTPTGEPSTVVAVEGVDFIFIGQRYNLEAGKKYQYTPELWTFGITGEKIEFGEGTVFALTGVTGENFSATIDPATGIVTAEWAQGATQGANGEFEVTVTLPGGATIPTTVNLTLGQAEFPTEASAYDISYFGDNIFTTLETGRDFGLSPTYTNLKDPKVETEGLPAGARAQLIESPTEPGMVINPENGFIAFLFNELPTGYSEYPFTVRVTFSDGSSKDIEGVVVYDPKEDRFQTTPYNERYQYLLSGDSIVGSEATGVLKAFFLDTVDATEVVQPSGTTFEVLNAPAGITLTVNNEGDITYAIDTKTAVAGENRYPFDLKINYSDGTSETASIVIVYTGQGPTTAKPEPIQTPAPVESPAPVATTDPAALPSVAPESQVAQGSVQGATTAGSTKAAAPAPVAQPKPQRAELARTGADSIALVVATGLVTLAAGAALIARRTKA